MGVVHAFVEWVKCGNWFAEVCILLLNQLAEENRSKQVHNLQSKNEMLLLRADFLLNVC